MADFTRLSLDLNYFFHSQSLQRQCWCSSCCFVCCPSRFFEQRLQIKLPDQKQANSKQIGSSVATAACFKSFSTSMEKKNQVLLYYLAKSCHFFMKIALGLRWLRSNLSNSTLERSEVFASKAELLHHSRCYCYHCCFEEWQVEHQQAWFWLDFDYD